MDGWFLRDLLPNLEDDEKKKEQSSYQPVPGNFLK